MLISLAQPQTATYKFCLSKTLPLSGSFMYPKGLPKEGHLWHSDWAVLARQSSAQGSGSQSSVMRPEQLLNHPRCWGFQQLPL